MAGKTFAENYPSTLTLTNSTYNPAIITGTITAPTGDGVFASGLAWTITNLGSVSATGSGAVGIDLTDGGIVTNGSTGQILGSTRGVGITGGLGSVANSATITANATGVYLSVGSVTNGASNSAGAYIHGRNNAGVKVYSGVGSVLNYGGIAGGYVGVGLYADGSVTNGAAASTAASISGIGGNAIFISNAAGTLSHFGDGVGTVLNFGTVSGSFNGVDFADGYGQVSNLGRIIGGSDGVDLEVGGGTVINGANASTGAYIGTQGTEGRDAVAIGVGYIAYPGAHGTVVNYGTIKAPRYGVAIYEGGGTVINGASTSTNAYIGGRGGDAVLIGSGTEDAGGLGTVMNFGTINGQTSGLELYVGGSVINGASDSTAAYIHGRNGNGILVAGGVGTVSNFGLISGSDAGVVLSAGGTVTNFGSIGDTGAAGSAIYLASTGGAVTNEAGGRISASFAIYAKGSRATITNDGTVSSIGASGSGIFLGSGGGAIMNEAAGVITADGFAVAVKGGPATITNNGVVSGIGASGTGVYLGSGGMLTNGAIGAAAQGLIGGSAFGVYVKAGAATVVNFAMITATGSAGTGISLRGGGSITDAGTISGAGGAAITFGGSGDNLLVLENGYKLGGVVQGGPAATNTLELAGSVGAAVTASYNGVGLTHFQDVLFGAGGNATLKVTNTSGTLPVTISGFTLTNDIVDLTAIGTNAAIANMDPVNHRVTITGSLGTETLQLDPSDGTGFMAASDGVSGTDITVACYNRGTLILTEEGEVPIEALVIGDKVVTLSGAARPIRWIGRRSYAGRFAFGQKHILPVCVKTGALGDRVPRRDLWVSPNHAFYLEEVLIEARDLVNGVSIVQPDAAEAIEYFHIELDGHAVIVAEGAPAESFIDDNSRGMFHNAHEYRARCPDAAAGPARYCAPRRDQGCEVERARAAIARRAGLPVNFEVAVLGPLRGQVDEVGLRRICGWAQDAAHPEAPVCLDIDVGGELIGHVVANRYRADLGAAGLGSGRHGFEFVAPAGLAFTPRSIQVRRSLDAASLTCSKALRQSAARRPRNASAR